MTRFGLVAALLLLALGLPWGAQCAFANQAAARQAPAAVAEAGANSVGDLRQRAEGAERRAAILEAKAELATESYSRLENIVAVFGVVIAVVGIIFGLSTRAVAIAEARENIKDLSEKFSREFAEQVERAKAEIETLRGQRAEFEKIVSDAKAVIERMSPEQTPSDPEERAKVATAADAVAHKAPAERSSDDLKSLIAAAQINADWEAVLRHARALLYLHGAAGRDTELHAIFHQALALTRLNRRSETIRLYQKIIDEFDEENYAKFVARSFSNLINSYCILGELDKAIEVGKRGVDRFQGHEDPDIVKSVEFLFYNLACVYAKKGSARDAVDALEKMRSIASEVNCEEIRLERDFDAIRDDPAFARFWEGSGCAARHPPEAS